MFRRSLTTLLLMLSTSSPTMAEGAATPQPHITGEQQEAANENTALKLAGLVTFVANSCPELTPDYDRFKAVVSALGVATDDLSKSDLKMKYLNYTATYQEDVKGNCEKAQSRFGDAGTLIKGLFHQK